MNLKATSLFSFSAIAVSALLFTTSCKKDNSNPGASAQMSATVNSTSFKPFVVTGLDVNQHIIIAGIQAIGGGDSVALALSVPDTAKAGQVISVSAYDNDLMTWGHSNVDLGYDSYEDNAHGTITVSGLDKTAKKVSGTFNAVLYRDNGSNDSVKVSGQFNTTYLTY